MEFRHLGDSGLKVSAIGLGTNNFGGRVDPEGTALVIDQALDEGINLVDTANIYGPGLSEEYIGRALKGKRHEAIIATKVSGEMGRAPIGPATPANTSWPRSRKASGAWIPTT